MTGTQIKSLMRKNHITIRDLASRMQITMKRVRIVRERGITNGNVIRDWVEAITGTDPGQN